METTFPLKLYVYGTLIKDIPGYPDNLPEPIKVPGLMYDMGWYPAAFPVPPRSDSPTFKAYPYIIDNEESLRRIDRYEGYSPDLPQEASLYLRVPLLDGWIYYYNSPTLPDGAVPWIENGDWLAYLNNLPSRSREWIVSYSKQ